MYTRASIVVAVAAAALLLQGALASPTRTPTETFLGTLPGDDKPCSTPVATVTTTLARAVCEPACLVPTSACAAGEPTGPTPRDPTTSTVASPGACTATLQVVDIPGCRNCATCTSAPAPTRRLPGEHQCVPTATVSRTVGPQATTVCACPLAWSSCAPGEPTARPLPTTTLREGCTEVVEAGPGDCSNVCPTCS